MIENCRRRKAQQWQEDNRRMMEQVANMALLKLSENQVGRHLDEANGRRIELNVSDERRVQTNLQADGGPGICSCL